MMSEDEYELMPHDEVIRLKEEIKKLKSGKGGSSLQDSIDTLNKNIENLLSIFKEAAEEIKTEDAELTKEIDKISDQNEKIANAILAVVDMIKKPGMPRMPPTPLAIPRPPLTAPRPIVPPPPIPRPLPRILRPPLTGPPKLPGDISMPPKPSPGGSMAPPPPPTPGPLPPLPPKKKGLFRR